MAKYILPQCITEVKAKIIKLEENLNDFLWLSKTVPQRCPHLNLWNL